MHGLQGVWMCGRCGRVSIEIIDNKKEWDNFVDNSYNGLLFHKWDFLKTVEKHSQMKLFTYGIYKGKELVAIFPLFLYSKYGLKFLLSPPPKTLIPELGFLVKDNFLNHKQHKKEEILRLIVENINSEIKKYNPIITNLKLTQGLYDVREFLWKNYRAIPQYTYIIQLDTPLNNIWNNLKKSARNGIRRAEKMNITIKKTINIEDLLAKLEKRYISQGLKFPAISKDYLKELAKQFTDNIESYYVVSENDKMLTGKIIIKFKSKYLNWIGDFKIEGYPGLQEYVMWEFIKKAKEEGFKVFDMVGADVKRLCLFKNQFNPTLSLHFLIEKLSFVGKLIKILYFKQQTIWR